jgi:hypothetical protein
MSDLDTLVTSDNRTYRPEDDSRRMMALAVFGETGSLATASRHTGVAKSTIAGWVDSEDGAETVEQLRISARANTAHKYMAVSSMALDKVMQRLVSGDPHVTKKGEIVYAPVKARDAAVIASIATDKTYLIAGALADGQKINQALRGLASELVAMVRKEVEGQTAGQGELGAEGLGGELG